MAGGLVRCGLVHLQRVARLVSGAVLRWLGGAGGAIPLLRVFARVLQ